MLILLIDREFDEDFETQRFHRSINSSQFYCRKHVARAKPTIQIPCAILKMNVLFQIARISKWFELEGCSLHGAIGNQ